MTLDSRPAGLAPRSAPGAPWRAISRPAWSRSGTPVASCASCR